MNTVHHPEPNEQKLSGVRQHFDWALAKQRLARAAVALDETQRLSPERASEILEQRARAVAQPPTQQVDARTILEVVTFTMSGESFAIEARHVLEVSRPNEITPVPGAAAFLVGVTNLRGDVLAVFDLRRFFGLEPVEQTSLSKIIVVGGQRMEFGLLADAVDQVTTLGIDEVLPPPGSVDSRGRECLRGVTANAVLVLDGAALLTDPRLFIDQGE